MCLYVYVFFILNEGQYSLCFCLSDCYPNHCKFECLKILALTNIFPSNFVFFVHLTAFLQGNELILPGLSDPSFMTLFCLHHSYFLLFKARAVSPVDSASPPPTSCLLKHVSLSFIKLLDLLLKFSFCFSSVVHLQADTYKCKDIVY